ncbi:IpaB/EvcA family protein [Lactobacillus sp. S2-2]|uniref:IpaB/EvcA family protein n=1 Tax=Lactobacillus sp. S2-2 TaxID=2692917 RepID=UPI001F33AF6C|nr:IpaB/EvcA family protein [Lactobacillus sp. S2-2]MCF6515846.1 IpaB/EvcA family protein [Lactobacillus sp. S2-2]
MTENNELKNIKLTSDTQSLINVVNQLFPGEVTVQFIGSLKAGFVRHDQAQIVQDGEKLYVQVSDLTEPNFIASHELLHLLMTLKGFPQVYFPLTSGDDKLDEQLQYVGTELYDLVCHFVVNDEQRKHGMITDKIKEEYFKGIRHTLSPEIGEIDGEMILRLVTLLDGFVFFGSEISKFEDQLIKTFPIAYDAAKKLYKKLNDKPVDSPFTLRRKVVMLFNAFDEQLKECKLPALQLNNFAMLTSVLSERQLKLKVNQVFDIYHSELMYAETGKRAYVGFTKSDDQNSFVADGPTGEKESAEYFKTLYDKTVKELFEDLKIPYLIR